MYYLAIVIGVIHNFALISIEIFGVNKDTQWKEQ